MGSFPVAIPDIASRAEFVRSQLEILRVSTFSREIFLRILRSRRRSSSGVALLLAMYIVMLLCKDVTNYVTEVTLLSPGDNGEIPSFR